MAIGGAKAIPTHMKSRVRSMRPHGLACGEGAMFERFESPVGDPSLCSCWPRLEEESFCKSASRSREAKYDSQTWGGPEQSKAVGAAVFQPANFNRLGWQRE
jgi:hypothetical protein